MPGPAAGIDRVSDAKAAYARLRAGHLRAVQAALEDHVTRLEWPRERIERYRDQRLRAFLAYARERSPFHAARMHGLGPYSATLTGLATLPVMTKRDAQEQRDAIVTVPGLGTGKCSWPLPALPGGRRPARSGASRPRARHGSWCWRPAGRRERRRISRRCRRAG